MPLLIFLLSFASYLLVFHIGLGSLYIRLGEKFEGFDPKRPTDEQDSVFAGFGDLTFIGGALIQIYVVPALAYSGSRRLFAAIVRRLA